MCCQPFRLSAGRCNEVDTHTHSWHLGTANGQWMLLLLLVSDSNGVVIR